ncbi:MAG: ABC transporter substrate-binding protein [Burkholderiales bacterium]
MKLRKRFKLAVTFGAALVGMIASATFARDITVAQVAAFSGAQAPSGTAIRAGIKLYFDEVNRAGGIGGDRIKLVTRDDAYKAEETVKIVKEMLERDAPVAFVGALGTANIEALIKDGALARANVPLIGAVSGASSLVGAPSVFVTKASWRDEVRELFELVSKSGVKRAAIFYQDDSMGRDVLAGAESAAPNYGMNLVVKATYERNTTNVDEAVTQIIRSDAQIVYLAAVTTAAIEFIKRYRAAGGLTPIYGLSIIDPGNVIKAVGVESARGYAFGLHAPLSSAGKFAIVREYQALRKASPNPELSERSVEGFIIAKTVVHALRQSRQVNSGAVLNALVSMRGVDLGDYWIDFTRPGRTGSRFVEFAVVAGNGRIDH